MIRLFYDNTVYRLRGSRKTLELVERVIREEKRIPGDLNFILTNKFEVQRINREFLKHDYYTDVIAFGYSENEVIQGEVYMSLETIKENSINYNVSLKNEIIRIMIHGALHLCGYEDGNEIERLEMREKEDYWIRIFEKSK